MALHPPIVVSDVAAFYRAAVAECPRCHSRWRLDTPPEMVLASDVLAGDCEVCGLFVVINMMNGGVVFEGYETADAVHARCHQLAEAFKKGRS